MKIGIVYFSSTGNTEAMAEILNSDLKEIGVDVDNISAENFSLKNIQNYDKFLFGCPAMGSEGLDEDTFRPMWDNVIQSLKDKEVGLFGSYDWGDGEWLETWEEEATDAGIKVVGTVSSNLEPDSDDEDNLKELAKKISK